MADLIQLGLYFCLRYYEYTQTSSHCRTVQFRYKDMQFHAQRDILPQDEPVSEFLATWSDTFFLDTQKNLVRGEYLTMEATGVPNGDPPVAVAHRYFHLRHHDTSLDTPNFTYFNHTLHTQSIDDTSLPSFASMPPR